VRPALALIGLLTAGAAESALPSVASINLCTDQLVLSVADPAQILSLSWLSADDEESMLAESAQAFPLNYGSAEELLRIGAEVVIAGSETSQFTRQLLNRLGARVVVVEPAANLNDIARNLEQVGAAIDRETTAAAAIAGMRARADGLRRRSAGMVRSAVVVRPGGFTIGRETLAFELLTLAGLENSIAELDRWGSLSIETLLRASPDFLVITRYRDNQASLANSIFAHPALAAVAQAPTTLNVAAHYFACGAPASLGAAEALLDQMTRR
jgi:iron complex transport system substrate-binding protein